MNRTQTLRGGAAGPSALYACASGYPSKSSLNKNQRGPIRDGHVRCFNNSHVLRGSAEQTLILKYRTGVWNF